MLFLYTDNELSEKEINKTIPYIVTHLGVHLTEKEKDLYTESYKTLMKEIEGLNKWEDILCSQIGRINIIKMFILSKANYRFNEISIKIAMAFYTEIKKKILKFMWNNKRP